MTKYWTNDGAEINAKNDHDLIHQLRSMSWTSTRTDIAFMAEVADRVRMQTGTFVSTDSPQEFVAGLLKSGFLKEEPSKESA